MFGGADNCSVDVLEEEEEEKEEEEEEEEEKEKQAVPHCRRRRNRSAKRGRSALMSSRDMSATYGRSEELTYQT
jgi:hypothetical protein